MKKGLSLIISVIMLISVLFCIGVSAADVNTAPAPTAIIHGYNDVTGVAVEWKKVADAEYYNVYRRKAGENETKLVAEKLTELRFLDEKVENNTYYKYTIKAVNKVGESEDSNSRLIKFVSTPALTRIGNVVGGIRITWNSVPNAQEYRVYRRGAGSNNWRYLGSVKNLYFFDKNVNSNEYYRYTVRAVNYYYSGFDTKGLYTKYVETPTEISLQNGEDGVLVRWYSNTVNDEYLVFRRGAGSKTWEFVGKSYGREIVDKNAENGKYYKYGVKAVSGNTVSSFIVNGPHIKFVEGAEITNVRNGQNAVGISWKEVPGATKYHIYRYVEELGFGVEEVGTTTGLSYADKSAYLGHNNVYKVVAENNGYKSFVPYGTEMAGKIKTIKFLPTKYLGAEETKRLYSELLWKANSEASYEVVSWQNLKSSKATGANNSFVSDFKKQMDSSFVPYAKAEKVPVTPEDNVQVLGSAEFNLGRVKTAKTEKTANGYKITIAFKPEKESEGINGGIMNTSANRVDVKESLLYLANEGLLDSGTGDAYYRDFVITAVFDENLHLVTVNHSCNNLSFYLDMDFVAPIGRVRYDATIGSYMAFNNFIYR